MYLYYAIWKSHIIQAAVCVQLRSINLWFNISYYIYKHELKEDIMKKFNIEFKGLSKRIFTNFLLLILVLLIFMEAATYYIMQTTINEINNNFIQVELRQKNEKLNNFVKEIDNFSKTIISDRETLDLLFKNSNTEVSKDEISRDMQYVLSNDIDAVFLFSNAGNTFSESDNELREYFSRNIEKIKSEIADTNGEMVFLDSRFIHYAADNHGDYMFFVARKLRSIDTFEDLGIMIMAVRESLLWKDTYMEGEKGDFYIANSAGKIISSKDKDRIGINVTAELGSSIASEKLKSSKGHFITNDLVVNTLYNQQTGWVLMNAVAIHEINANFYYIQKFILIIGIAAIVVAVYISVLISSNVTRPIRDMIFTMRKVSDGDLNAQTDLSLTKGATEEVRELSEVFNHMTMQLQSLLEEVYNEGLKEKDAELRALKAQIQPHFLYNTLDTVYWMLIDKNDYEIADIVTKLGEILRYSIKKGSTNVFVREEVQQIKNYLFLQKARFEDCLNYEINIDESIMECEMLSFIIQPFVENSINHGLMQDKGYGNITINGFRDGENLIFEIIDDGSGMTEKEIEELFRKKKDVKESHGGIGVLNVHERIKYYYGGKYGVKIESRKGFGTKVIVEISLTMMH